MSFLFCVRGCMGGIKYVYLLHFTFFMNKKNHIHITPTQALSRLEGQALFTSLFRHGSLLVEVYRPRHTDLQQPHSRDELYVVISGSGVFCMEDKNVHFAAGDFLFVPAGAEHRFVEFSNDFATWVFFYGPEGGEVPNMHHL